MQALPDSRLLLVAQDGDGAAQPAIAARLERCGIPPKRARIIGRRPMREFLRLFLEVDIALDPFPCSGGTTSLHTLWMGVPIVTLAGETELSRSTAGMLQGMGLDYLVATTWDGYYEAALRLAQDGVSLAQLRAGMREHLQGSAIFDARAVTRSLESALRETWRGYVSGNHAKAEASPLE
jgi:predicted O-linked N-acetylglucosamine transferase (SPINDLY family)